MAKATPSPLPGSGWKHQNFRVLPLARNAKHGAFFFQTMHFPRKECGCQPWLRLRSVIHSSALPTLPNRRGVGERASAGGVHIRRGGLLLHVAFLSLGANGNTPKFWFFVTRVNNEKLGHMLKHLPKFRPDLSTRSKGISENRSLRSLNR